MLKGQRHRERAKAILTQVDDLRQGRRSGSWGAQADKLTNEALAHAVLALNDTLREVLEAVEGVTPDGERLN